MSTNGAQPRGAKNDKALVSPHGFIDKIMVLIFDMTSGEAPGCIVDGTIRKGF
jgi:hypothetical protein